MNAQIYSLLLTLCPADLRREFGAEMTQIFLDDLQEHRLRFGFPGVARVWWQSLKDLCGVALREAIAQHQFAVPLIVCAVELLYFGTIAIVRRDPLPSAHEMLPVFSTPPMVAFVAARVANSDVLMPLKLERR